MSSIMASAYKRTRHFLEQEMGVALHGHLQSRGNVDVLPLYDTTVIVGVGGTVNVFIAFTFQRALLDELTRRFTADIVVPAARHEQYRRASAEEIVNIIVGHCTGDLPQAGGALSLSAPAVIEQERTVWRPSDAVFTCMSLRTAFGCIDISFVGPCELFDQQLNYLN
ncbi:chemotaxis protein CheX [Rugamonas apoptosis]|uniref:Chemotaxis protein CheX n=1 Tax=Rugamonas apoptosis TaxID=2758570 RepID=A0A7W2F959_9BURK|nr:chemotaxis protein CheX [Rugamonas apoptosis]MBA5687411.1 chemotaxis protein CheX [Rugamonas apoptosis]